jgi:hypothetical protein
VKPKEVEVDIVISPTAEEPLISDMLAEELGLQLNPLVEVSGGLGGSRG